MGLDHPDEGGRQASEAICEVTREVNVEDRLGRVVKAEGGLVLKLPSHWYRGIPDRLVLLPRARIFFIELKRRGKKARANQRRWIKLLRRLGFVAGVIEGHEALDRFISKHLHS